MRFQQFIARFLSLVLGSRSTGTAVEQQGPDLIALRRVEARRFLRSRGIKHVRGVYGSPGGHPCNGDCAAHTPDTSQWMTETNDWSKLS